MYVVISKENTYESKDNTNVLEFYFIHNFLLSKVFIIPDAMLL